MSSVWWRFARGLGARWGVVALWVLGATLSYSALRDLAVMLGFPALLADLFPLVIDVAVWVGSMNALEAREHGRQAIERYAWALVALYSSTTVAGNALVAWTDAVDPRLVRALGNRGAHAVSGIAHAAPAVTMILFAHLAGLLTVSRSQSAEVATDAAEAATEAAPRVRAGQGARSAMSANDRPHRVTAHRDPSPDMAAPAAVRSDGHDHRATVAMTASEVREAAVRLVREGRATGHDVTAADVQRVTGRGPRQCRRLLALAVGAVDGSRAGTGRPWVVEADG